MLILFQILNILYSINRGYLHVHKLRNSEVETYGSRMVPD